MDREPYIAYDDYYLSHVLFWINTETLNGYELCGNITHSWSEKLGATLYVATMVHQDALLKSKGKYS